MLQKLLGDLNDLIILILLIYVSLVFNRILKFPTKNWKTKFEEIEKTKRGTFLKIAFPLLTLFFQIKIISEMLS
jgi:hypothetical protein